MPRIASCFAIASPAIAAALVCAPLAASAQEPSIDVELNRLQQVDDACRLSLVFTNRLPVEIATIELETVLFDADDRASRFLVLKSQGLTPGKIRVHQYNLDGTACDEIGGILVNDVVTCEGEGLDPGSCLGRIAASSREKADLFLTISDREGEQADAGAATEAAQ